MRSQEVWLHFDQARSETRKIYVRCPDSEGFANFRTLKILWIWLYLIITGFKIGYPSGYDCQHKYYCLPKY